MNVEEANVVIKVIGIGNAGVNIISYIQKNNIEGINYILIDDKVYLKEVDIINTVILRNNIDEGKSIIQEELRGTNLLFLVGDIATNSETNIISIISELTTELALTTVAIIISPHELTSSERIYSPSLNIDSIIQISEKGLLPLSKEGELSEAKNKILLDIVRGMTTPITQSNIIGFDFADLKTLICKTGTFSVGIGMALGKNRAIKATKKALSFPLFIDIQHDVFYGILVNISSQEMSISEFDEIGNLIHFLVPSKTIIKVAVTYDNNLKGEMKVTLIATGIGRKLTHN